MTRRTARRGLTLIEVMVGVMVLAATFVAASAMFPLSSFLRDRSGSSSRAAALVQRKLEQIRELPVTQINYTGLRAAGLIDEGNTTPYSFTATDSLATELTTGSGELTITNGGTDLVRVDITVRWKSVRGQAQSLSAVTFVTNKALWVEN